jgi:hypothetical protein
MSSVERIRSNTQAVDFGLQGAIVPPSLRRLNTRLTTWTLATSILIAVLALTATLIPRSAHADPIVFQDRVVFARALDSDPSVVKTVEGWDTYPAGTIFPDGSRVNGITYSVSSSGAALS